MVRGFKPWFCHWLTLWSWEASLTTLNCYSLVHQMGNNTSEIKITSDPKSWVGPQPVHAERPRQLGGESRDVYWHECLGDLPGPDRADAPLMLLPAAVWGALSKRENTRGASLFMGPKQGRWGGAIEQGDWLGGSSLFWLGQQSVHLERGHGDLCSSHFGSEQKLGKNLVPTL